MGETLAESAQLCLFRLRFLMLLNLKCSCRRDECDRARFSDGLQGQGYFKEVSRRKTDGVIP